MNQINCIGLVVFFSVAGSIEARGRQEGAPEANSSIRHVVIEVATAETPRSDTASIAELTDGRLMVVYHKYERGEHSGHDHGTCRIWSKVSRDGGETWEHPRMLVDVDQGDMNVQAPALLRLKSGLLLLTCLRAHQDGSSSTMCLFSSNDDGETFSSHGKSWQIIGNLGDDPKAEYTNLDCLFTSKGDALVTYMYAKPAWNRNQIHLRAALIPRAWFHEAGVDTR